MVLRLVLAEKIPHSVQSAARELRVSQRQVRYWIHHGNLRAFRCGRALLIKPANLERFLCTHWISVGAARSRAVHA